MSFSYDIGSLGCGIIPDNFKIIVINNGGGGIFRFISTTSQLEELDDYFTADPKLPILKLAEAFGFRSMKAASESELTNILPHFFTANDRPSLLEILTPPEISAEILTNYMNRNKQ